MCCIIISFFFNHTSFFFSCTWKKNFKKKTSLWKCKLFLRNKLSLKRQNAFFSSIIKNKSKLNFFQTVWLFPFLQRARFKCMKGTKSVRLFSFSRGNNFFPKPRMCTNAILSVGDEKKTIHNFFPSTKLFSILF